MDEAQWWIVDILGAAILLGVLLWVVMRTRGNRDDATNRRAEKGTHDLYEAEEARRREGTDDL
jgi:hypothetical protein